VINIIRKYRNFRGSLQCLQQPAVCSYTVLDDCVLLYYSMMSNDPFLCDFIYSEVFLLVFLIKICLLQLCYPYHFILPCYERASSIALSNNI